MSKSRTDSRTKQLWELIFLTLEVLEDNGNHMNAKDLSRIVARQTGISNSDMPYIINSAQAEYLVTHSLRSNMVVRTNKPILHRLIETESYDTFLPLSKEAFKAHVKKYLSDKYGMVIESTSLPHLISIYETSKEEPIPGLKK